MNLLDLNKEQKTTQQKVKHLLTKLNNKDN